MELEFSMHTNITIGTPPQDVLRVESDGTVTICEQTYGTSAEAVEAMRQLADKLDPPAKRTRKAKC